MQKKPIKPTNQQIERKREADVQRDTYIYREKYYVFYYIFILTLSGYDVILCKDYMGLHPLYVISYIFSVVISKEILLKVI